MPPTALAFAPHYSTSCAHFSAHPGPAIDADRYRREVAALALGELHGEPVLPPVAAGTVREEVYRFEQERYGGPGSRAAVEDHFCVSSTLALKAIRHVARPLRPSWAVEALAAGVAALPGGARQRARFFDACFATGWKVSALARFRNPQDAGYRPYGEVRASVRAALLACDPELSTAASAHTGWRASLRESIASTLDHVAAQHGRSRGDAEAPVLASLLHMLGNRIGLSHPDEVYLSWILAHGYREVAAEPS